MENGIIRRTMSRLFTRVVVDGDDDAVIEERLFGGVLVLRLAFAKMARGYRPEISPGFAGTVVYTLTRASGAPDLAFTLDVYGSRAVSSRGAPGPDSPVAVRIRIPVVDFIRIAAGEMDPAEPMLNGRASFTGELGLASRLPEMFGAPTPR